MKKALKIIMLFAIVTVVAFLLTGCGSSKDTETSKKGNGEYQGATNGAGNNLKNVTADNYKDVAKEVFGIEIGNHAGWTLDEAESPNGVNNLNIEYTVSNGEDGKGIVESYFNKTLTLGKVYSYGFNDEYTAMVKGEQFTSFETFAEENLTNFSNFYQAMWIYECNGKDIQIAVSVDDASASIALVLLSQ